MNTLAFTKFVQEGTHYEIGRQRGEYARNNNELTKCLTELPEGMLRPSNEDIRKRQALFEKWCPGIGYELKGLADGLNVAEEQLTHYCYGYNEHPRGCSIVAVSPHIAMDGHTLVARSYEYSSDDELIYSVTRVDGKYAHAGFSLFHVGRFDGINEKGMCVAISSTECVHSSDGEGNGIHFWIAVRSVLDNCANTEEALRLLEDMPIASNVNIMLADSLGDCAVVEILNLRGVSTKAVRRNDGYLCAFNHYRDSLHTSKFPGRRYFSAVREDIVDKFMREHGKVEVNDLKDLLSDRIPAGLCCHAYSDWFGTLRSMVFDVTEHKLWVCFGSPESGSWFQADLNAKVELVEYEIPYTDEKKPEYFWEEKEY
ncbi:MAG TPA: C45 family peptidase [Lachnospiraceae bacterium]|nr:C45 family peptidase [Lachnospiraceae bacterium]